MKLPALLQPRVLREALASLFSKPFTERFPAEPFTPDESFRGRPRFLEEGCVACGACAQVCPPKCIEVIDDLDPERPTRTLVSTSTPASGVASASDTVRRARASS